VKTRNNKNLGQNMKIYITLRIAIGFALLVVFIMLVGGGGLYGSRASATSKLSWTSFRLGWTTTPS